jgi:hypothetical protein
MPGSAVTRDVGRVASRVFVIVGVSIGASLSKVIRAFA